MSAQLTTTVMGAVPRRSRRWRKLYFAGLAAAVGAIGGGVAFATLTANGTGPGSAATSSVTIGAPVVSTCTYPHLEPGDSMSNCSMGVTYTGATSAWMSLTVMLQAKAGTIGGAKPLYDGTNSSGLTLSISDGHRSFTVPTGAGVAGGSCPIGYTCWTAANDLAAWYSGSTPNLSFANGKSVTWTVTPVFLRGAGNPYQGSTATLTLTAQAVQSAVNPLPASCTTSTIGQPCPASGLFAWS